MYALLCALAFGHDVSNLGHEDWEVREAAQSRLERWSWLNWGWLEGQSLAGKGPFGDPEVRRRALDAARIGPSLPVCRPITDFMGACGWWYEDHSGVGREYRKPRCPPGQALTWVLLPNRHSWSPLNRYLHSLIQEDDHAWRYEWVRVGPAKRASHDIAVRLARSGVPVPLLRAVFAEREPGPVPPSPLPLPAEAIVPFPR